MIDKALNDVEILPNLQYLSTSKVQTTNKMAENKYLEVDKDSFPYVFMKNVDLPLRTYQKGFLRCNVYLPKDAAPFGPERYPVIATYGPCKHPRTMHDL